MFDGGAQFTNIARPVVGEKRIHGVRSEFEERLTVFLAKVAKEAADQDWNVFFSFAQRRHGDTHHIEPEEKVVSKFSFAHELLEILVCGCDQPHIGAQRLISTDALESALFADYTQ